MLGLYLRTAYCIKESIMGRKAKYAQKHVYQPYVDHARTFFDIPDGVYIDFGFGRYTYKGGYAKMYSMEYHEIRLDKRGGHAWILEAILHELKHVEQKVTKRYTPGNSRNTVIWEGKEMPFYNLTTNKNKRGNRQNYWNAPWEVEARQAEKLAKKIFPNDALPEKRIYLGAIGNVKIYKVKGNV